METVVLNKNNGTTGGLIGIQLKNLTIPNIITYFTLAFSLGGIYLLLNSYL